MSFCVIVNLTSAVCCLVFYIFLFIIYFSKKNMNNIENKIYKFLLLFNGLYVLTLTICLTMVVLMNNYSYDPSLFNILVFLYKIAIVFLISWFIFLCFYIYVVTNEKKENFIENINNNYKKYFIALFILILCISTIHMFEKFHLDLNIGGESVLLYTFNGAIIISMIIDLILIFKNIKSINKKKVLPIAAIIPLLSLCWSFNIMSLFSLNSSYGSILFFYMIITLVDYLMYHTIENPDLKVINELTLAKETAEKASNAKSEFLSSMSHELKTPLNAIVGLTESIKSSDDFNDIRVDADDILSASSKLLELVNGILDINKLDSNSMEVINTIYNPTEEFDSVCNMINIRIGDKPLKFNIRLSDNLPSKLYGDKEKIKQIISNLLTNAVKYTDNGSIELVVDCLNNNDVCNLRLSVSDTGRGIDDSELDKLFTKFYRRDEDKDSDIEGAGLGLAITKSLVDLLGGKISVNSSPSFGTTFTVTITQKIINE
ncbi:MAG: HAMP domain-containing histidine kinase [Bacilli bacterium]|nr:HAMP domain-containing histidine kinase [Bacilli bacterium]